MSDGTLIFKLSVDQIFGVLRKRLRLNDKDINEVIFEFQKIDRKNHLNWDSVLKIKEAEIGNHKQE
jgi:hypothetical protein